MNVVDYVLQIYGFLIQTVPVALLWYVPFEGGKMRISGGKLAAVLVGKLAGFSLGFAALSGYLMSAEEGMRVYMRAAANLYMGTVLLLEVGFLFWNVRAGWGQKLLTVILLVHYAAVLFTVCGILIGMLHPEVDRTDSAQLVYGPVGCRLYTLLSLFTVLPLFLFLKGSIRSACQVMEQGVARRGCIYFLSALFLFCTAIYGLNTTEYPSGFYGLGLCITLFAFLATDCILYIMFFHEMRAEARTKELEDDLRRLDSRYRQIHSNIEEARRARHDIRHHLNVISVLNREGDRKGIQDYLARYEAVYQKQEERYFCGYPALDSILKYYVQKAETEGIRVKTRIASLQEEPGIDVVDLTVLVGNLLENAVTACLSLGAKEESSLEISIRREGTSLLFLVKNSCGNLARECERFEDYRAFSSARHGQRERQGLRSIHAIAEKYGGSAEFRAWKGTFTARVVLNLPV